MTQHVKPANFNTIVTMTSSARDVRDQNDHVAADLYGNTSTQGALTIIGRVDQEEMAARMAYSSDVFRFPGGDDRNCLTVSEFDPIIGPRGRGTGTRNYVWAFSSLNGMTFGDFENIEQLQRSLCFWGLSRSDHAPVNNPYKQTVPDKHGFSIICFGICSMRGRFAQDIFPGDSLVWRLPGISEIKMLMSSKSTTRHPKGKLTVIVETLDWSFLEYSLKNVCQVLLRSGNDIGISHRLGFDTRGYDGEPNSDKASYVRSARAIKTHTLANVVQGVEVLAMRKMVEIITPYKKAVKLAERKLLFALLDFAKTKLNPVVGGLADKPTLRAAAASMGIEGKRIAGIDPSSVEARAGDAQGALIRAYMDYGDVRSLPKTDVATKTNVMFGDEFDKPYVHFTSDMDKEELYRKGYLRFEDPNSGTEAKKALMDFKMERVNEVLFLAYSLGIIDGGKGEQTVVTQDLISATHMKLADEPNNTIKYLTGYPLGAAVDTLPTRAQKRMMMDYKTTCENSPIKYAIEAGKMVSEVMERKIGTAVSHAPASSLETILDVGLKF